MPRLIALKDLASYDAMICRLTVLEFAWPAGSVYAVDERMGNQIYYMVAGERDYYAGDTFLLHAAPGDLLFMPDQAGYRSVVGKELNDGICIVFSLRDAQGHAIAVEGGPRLIARDQDGAYAKRIRRLMTYAMQGGHANLRAKAALYELLSDLVDSQRTQAMDASAQAIYPAIRYMEQNLRASIAVSELASCCHMSESTFFRKFQHHAGMTPVAYHQARRIDKCRELLASGLYTVEQVAESMGFCDASYFSRTFKRLTGTSPGAFRAQRS